MGEKTVAKKYQFDGDLYKLQLRRTLVLTQAPSLPELAAISARAGRLGHGMSHSPIVVKSL
jgi:hypothetical protein